VLPLNDEDIVFPEEKAILSLSSARVLLLNQALIKR